jgi:hypothetical protein
MDASVPYPVSRTTLFLIKNKYYQVSSEYVLDIVQVLNVRTRSNYMYCMLRCVHGQSVVDKVHVGVSHTLW